MTVHGYARVSTADQVHDGQILALRQAGIDLADVTVETVSGSVPAARRPGLGALLGRLISGDTLAVARLDRLGRDPPDVLTLLRDLDRRGVHVRLLDLGADTASPAGRLVVAVLAAVAGWERDVLRDRTRQGLAAAKDRGQALGRRRTLTPHQRREAARLAGEGSTVAQVASLFGCARSVAHRAIQEGRQSS